MAPAVRHVPVALAAGLVDVNVLLDNREIVRVTTNKGNEDDKETRNKTK